MQEIVASLRIVALRHSLPAIHTATGVVNCGPKFCPEICATSPPIAGSGSPVLLIVGAKYLFWVKKKPN